jgi:hypothetical protein
MESASWHRKPSKSKKIRNSVSTSPGTDQFTRLGSSSLASPQYGQLSAAMGSLPEHKFASVHTPAELESPYRCNRTIRSWKERSGSSTCLIGLAVHEYHLTCVHIHILMNNEFSTLVQSPYTQNSNNKSDSCPRTRLRISPVTRLQSHKDPEGSGRRSYRRFWATPPVPWQNIQDKC